MVILSLARPLVRAHGPARAPRAPPAGPTLGLLLLLPALAMLVVEVDGSQHIGDVAYDADRTAYLANKGYRVIRVWNNDVMQRMDGVLAAILSALSNVPSPSHASHGPLPLPAGERAK